MSLLVLVIDPNAPARLRLQRILVAEAFAVVTATDVTIGVSLFRRRKPDFVIVDVAMPQQEGIRTILRMRIERPDSKLIAVTGGRGNQRLMRIARQLGADGTLAKPFDRKRLLGVLRSVLSGDASFWLAPAGPQTIDKIVRGPDRWFVPAPAFHYGVDEHRRHPIMAPRRETFPDLDEATAKPHYLGHRERLRERLLEGGTEALPDYELLEFLLFAARVRGDTKPLAKALIARFKSLAGVLGAERDALLGVAGMGEASAAALLAVREAGRRMLRAEVQDRPVLASWQKVIDYCTAAAGFGEVEEFRLLFLDRKNVLIADERQERGTIDHAPVYPREVVKRALALGASAIILVHNHPSGDTTPSRGDIEVTRAVVQAAAAVGIAVHDHLVIGRGRHSSFKTLGLM